MGNRRGVVYLLHFETPYKHARHYLGWSTAEGLDRRVATDLGGRCDAPRLMQVIAAAGISARLVRTWPGATRAEERRLKNKRNTPHLCPVCNPGGPWPGKVGRQRSNPGVQNGHLAPAPPCPELVAHRAVMRATWHMWPPF